MTNDEAKKINQNTLFATECVLIQLIAKFGYTEEVIWFNELCNSPYAICPLRYKFEEESRENVRKEANRVREEVKNLKPYSFESMNTKVVIQV